MLGQIVNGAVPGQILALHLYFIEQAIKLARLIHSEMLCLILQVTLFEALTLLSDASTSLEPNSASF